MITLDIETVANVPKGHLPAVAKMAKKRGQTVDEFAALCPALCKVVAVGMYCDRRREAVVETTENQTEPQVLTKAFEFIQFDNAPKNILTFNGRSFDIPVLLNRARIHQVQPIMLLKRCMDQKPWEHEPHIDLMQLLSFGGAAQKYSLEAWAIGFGLQNPKATGGGARVGKLVKAGRWEELVEYCKGDLRTTYQIYQQVKKIDF